MCSSSPPPPQPLPAPRAQARAPMRSPGTAPQQTGTAGARRRTVVNSNPDMIRRAMTAQLGGTGVVLGG